MFDYLVELVGFEAALIIVIFLGFMLIAILIAPTVQWLYRKIPYFYPVSGIRTMEGKLLSSSKIKELTEADNVPVFISSLEGLDYPTYLSLENGYEVGLRLYLAHTQEEIDLVIPQHLRGFFDSFVRARWDIRNIKRVLLEAYSKERIIEMPVDLIRIGTIDFDLVKSMYETQELGEILPKLDETEYAALITEGVRDWRETGSISPLTTLLFRYYFSKCHRLIEDIKGEDREDLLTLIGTIIDITNIRLIIRLKVDQVPPETIKENLIYPGFEIDPETMNSLVQLDKIEDILNLLTATPYGEFITQAIKEFERDKDYVGIEKYLQKILISRVRDISLKRSFGAGPIIAFLLIKEIEIDCVRSILTGIQEGLSPDEIDKYLALETT